MSLTTQSLISPRMDTLIGGEKVTSGTNSTPENVHCYLEELREQITPLREELLHHSIYSEVCSLERLREFMQIHVFAVRDVMSLGKRFPRLSRPESFIERVVQGERWQMELKGYAERRRISVCAAGGARPVTSGDHGDKSNM